MAFSRSCSFLMLTLSLISLQASNFSATRKLTPTQIDQISALESWKPGMVQRELRNLWAFEDQFKQEQAVLNQALDDISQAYHKSLQSSVAQKHNAHNNFLTAVQTAHMHLNILKQSLDGWLTSQEALENILDDHDTLEDALLGDNTPLKTFGKDAEKYTEQVEKQLHRWLNPSRRS